MGKRTSDFVALATVLGGVGVGFGLTSLFARSAPVALLDDVSVHDVSVKVRIVPGRVLVRDGYATSSIYFRNAAGVYFMSEVKERQEELRREEVRQQELLREAQASYEAMEVALKELEALENLKEGAGLSALFEDMDLARYSAMSILGGNVLERLELSVGPSEDEDEDQRRRRRRRRPRE